MSKRQEKVSVQELAVSSAERLIAHGSRLTAHSFTYCLLLTAYCSLFFFNGCSGGGGGGGNPVSVTPAPEYGSLYISSYPSGAKIFLDGKETGNITPSFLLNVPSGQHTITLSKEDYEDWGKTIQLGVSEQVTIAETEAILNPKTGGVNDPPPMP